MLLFLLLLWKTESVSAYQPGMDNQLPHKDKSLLSLGISLKDDCPSIKKKKKSTKLKLNQLELTMSTIPTKYSVVFLFYHREIPNQVFS